MQERFSVPVSSMARGVIIGTAFGDCFGIPFECRTSTELSLLRRCWIAQVLHQHPELEQFRRRAGSEATDESNERAPLHVAQQQRSTLPAAPITATTAAANKIGTNALATASSVGEVLSGMTNTSSASLPAQEDYAPRKGNTNNNVAATTAAAQQGNIGGNSNNVSAPPPPSANNSVGGMQQQQRARTDDDGGADTPKNQPLFFPPRDASRLGPFDYQKVLDHPFIPPEFEVGMWTDDTQLSCAMSRALRSSLVDDIDGTGKGAMLSKQNSSAAIAAATSAGTSGAAAGNNTNNNNARRALRRARKDDAAEENKNSNSAAAATTTANVGDDADISSAAQQQQQQVSAIGKTKVTNASNNDGGGQDEDEENSSNTDEDSQLTKQIKFFHLAREHVVEHQRSLAGWGGTRTAIERLIRPVEEMRAALAQADESPELRNTILSRFDAHKTSGNAAAVGNGVLMKLTPLALVFGVEQALLQRHQFKQQLGPAAGLAKQQQRHRIASRERLVLELTKMTHGSGDALATALVHSHMMTTLVCSWFSACVLDTLVPSGGAFGVGAGIGSSSNSKGKSSSARTATPNVSQQQQQRVSSTSDGAPTPAATNTAATSATNNGSNNNNNNTAQRNRGSPLFDSFPSSSQQRAAIVAAMFKNALDSGINFCEELSVGEVGDSTTSTFAEISFPESFGRICDRLKRVRELVADLQQRHQNLVGEESINRGDLFPFISRSEREEIETRILDISEGATYHCVHSFSYVWAYLSCFAPTLGVSCAREDAVPCAVAHSALLGGDADSNAAMIGGILGIIFGNQCIEPHIPKVGHSEVCEEAIECLQATLHALLQGRLAPDV